MRTSEERKPTTQLKLNTVTKIVTFAGPANHADIKERSFKQVKKIRPMCFYFSSLSMTAIIDHACPLSFERHKDEPKVDVWTKHQT